MGEHPFTAYRAHPLKVRGFAGWLQRVHSVDLSEPLLAALADRNDPYDRAVMLGAEPPDA